MVVGLNPDTVKTSSAKPMFNSNCTSLHQCEVAEDVYCDFVVALFVENILKALVPLKSEK